MLCVRARKSDVRRAHMEEHMPTRSCTIICFHHREERAPTDAQGLEQLELLPVDYAAYAQVADLTVTMLPAAAIQKGSHPGSTDLHGNI